MFSNGFDLDRKDMHPSSPSASAKSPAKNNPPADGKRRGRAWAMIALAASVAVPPGVWSLPRLLAADAPAPQPLPPVSPATSNEVPTGPILAAEAPADPVTQARDLLASGKYEDARDVLAKVDTSKLSDADRQAFVAAKTDVDQANSERQAARTAFKTGEEARIAGRNVEAARQFQVVLGNRFADPATREKAQTQLLLVSQTAPASPAATPAEQGPTMPGLSPREMYLLAKEEYKVGDYRSAKRNFEAAKAANYQPPLAQDTPARYLDLIEKREQAMATSASPTTGPTTPAANPTTHPTDVAMNLAAPGTLPTASVPAIPTTQPTEAAITPATPATNPAVARVPTAAEIAGVPEATPATNPSAVPAVATTPSTQPAVAVTPTTNPAVAQGEGTITPQNLAAGTTAEQDLRRYEELQQIQKQAKAYKARQLLAEGRKAESEQRDQEALRLYLEAYNLDPENQIAFGKIQEIQIKLGNGPATGGGIDDMGRTLAIRHQQVTYDITIAKDKFETNLAAKDFNSARANLEQTRAAITGGAGVLTADEARGYNTMVTDMAVRLDQAQTTEAQRLERLRMEEEARRVREQAEIARRQNERTIADLIVTARKLTTDGNYREALGVVDQILLHDAHNDYATGVRPLLEDKMLFLEQRKFRERFDIEASKQLNNAEEKKIPYDDILRYPADWPDISAIRDQANANDHGQGVEERAMQAQLDRKLLEVNFQDQTFEEAITWLRDTSQTNIFVNWTALQAAGVDRAAKINLHLYNIKVSKALQLVLDAVSSPTAKLGSTIDEGVISITTGEELSKNVSIRVYDIRDLIIDVPNFTDAPDFDLTQQSQQGNQGGGGAGGGGGGGGGGGQGLFNNQNKQDKDVSKTKEELVKEIIDLIQNSVPGDWKDNGGMTGSIKELSGQLVVTQTPENHRALSNLLDQLREQKSIQITIEARFLTVQRNFLEDVGMDFDFVFNVNGSNSRRLSPIVVNNDSSTFTQGPTTPIPGSIGTTAQGLTTAATFLDDFQVNLLLRATQANQSSAVVTAPRITLFNGQRAYVLIATQRAYVSDLQPSVGQNTASFAPTVSVVESGVVLDVQATVSADRKYVTMTLRPQLAQLIALRDFVFQNGSNAVSNPAGGGGPVFIGGNGGLAPTGIIQTPEIQITEVRTTVSCPDGGTLLLGGQTLAGEIEKEAGVPVLSKIPGLKRLFTNRSMAKDEQVLLILVRPTIIIQKEVEQRQFPLLNTRS